MTKVGENRHYLRFFKAHSNVMIFIYGFTNYFELICQMILILVVESTPLIPRIGCSREARDFLSVIKC